MCKLFAILNTKFPLPFHKFRQKLANTGSTELYCLFIAADSVVDAISFIRCIVQGKEGGTEGEGGRERRGIEGNLAPNGYF